MNSLAQTHTNTMDTNKHNRSLCLALLKKCEDIHDKYGGYDYHDEMLIQLAGLNTSIEEYEEEDWQAYCRGERGPKGTPSADWGLMLADATQTHEWFDHVSAILELQSTLPDNLYA